MEYATSARSSATLSEAPSYQSLRSVSSGFGARYSHPLYSAIPGKKDCVIVTEYGCEESHFSSCSTSPNTSCESLGAFPIPPADASRLPPLPRSSFLSTRSSLLSSRSTSYGSKYADDHYPLISTVSNPAKVHSATLDMAHAYNTYIRAINSCYNHSLIISADEIEDFLFFCQTLFNVLSQHLKVEQQYLQPSLNRPAANHPLGTRKTVSIHEDHIFQSSFHSWANYVHDPSVRESFTGEKLKGYMSTFAPLLIQHLHNEVSQISTLVTEGILMPQHLSNIWTRFEEILSDHLDLYTDTALLVGCYDRNFTVNGQRGDQKFPRLPMGTTIMVKKWHSRRHAGAWRFCSSDFSGKRRVISA